MRNVLSANLLRLKKSRVLALCMAYMLYDGLRLFYSAAQMAGEGHTRDAPSFQFLWLGGIVFAVYCSFFIAGEYAEGGVRRKVVSGAPRPAVYLANLLSCAAACLLISLLYIVPNWTLEYLLVGSAGGLNYIRTPGQTALFLLECVVVILSYNAIFTMIGMNIQHKTGGPIAVLLAAAGLIYFGHSGRDMLLLQRQSPESWPLSPLTTLRCKLFAEWLPGGQAIHCVQLDTDWWAPEGMILRGLAVIALSTAIGIALFQRKDLK